MYDYTSMSLYYDLIMKSGYYNYEKIVDNFEKCGENFDSILEIGCGTGLILQELGKRYLQTDITGIDFTAAMLSIAAKRLQEFPKISLLHQNVTALDLEKSYDLAFSYGGVWYFVVNSHQEPFLVSHLDRKEENRTGLAHVARHVKTGGRLLLGTQGPHYNYAKTVSNGMIYSQKIDSTQIGFDKQYYITRNGEVVMAQTINYRTYDWPSALDLLSEAGFSLLSATDQSEGFMVFVKA